MIDVDELRQVLAGMVRLARGTPGLLRSERRMVERAAALLNDIDRDRERGLAAPRACSPAAEEMTMNTQTFADGSRVNFLPGPRASARVDGKVLCTETTGSGRGRSTFLVVACDDGRERRIRPGAARAA